MDESGEPAATNDLRALHMIYSAIMYYESFPTSPKTRDQLLLVAGRAIGSRPRTLSDALSNIEIAIAKFRSE